MEAATVDFETLVGSWRGAFDAAAAALRAGRYDLPGAELGARAARLADERVATERALRGVARGHEARRQLLRLVATPWEARRLLGLPPDAAACVFDLEGVLIGSARIHPAAWHETFDELIARRVERTGGTFAPFDVAIDYPAHLHGRPRLEGIRAFLASRGINLPEGAPGDPPGAETVHGLANRKRLALLRRLDDGVPAHEGARLYLQLVRDAGLHSAVVSASANTAALLERARLDALVEERVDGTAMAAEHLEAKPAALLAACRHLHVEPARTAVFETTRDGVAAGRAAGFEVVVGVGRGDAAGALRAGGADRVVSDLGELLETALAA